MWTVPPAGFPTLNPDSGQGYQVAVVTADFQKTGRKKKKICREKLVAVKVAMSGHKAQLYKISQILQMYPPFHQKMRNSIKKYDKFSHTPRFCGFCA